MQSKIVQTDVIKAHKGPSDDYCATCEEKLETPAKTVGVKRKINVVDLIHGERPPSQLESSAPALPLPSWISVTDRLPTHVYSVLLWITAGRLHQGEDYSDVGIYNAERRRWQVAAADEDEVVTVSHWAHIGSPRDFAPSLSTSAPVPDWEAVARNIMENYVDDEYVATQLGLEDALITALRSAYAKGCGAEAYCWIPVEVKLPPATGEVLVWLVEDEGSLAHVTMMRFDSMNISLSYCHARGISHWHSVAPPSTIEGRCGADYRDGIQRAIQIVKAIGAEGATYNDDQIMLSIITIELEKALLPAPVDENPDSKK